MKLGELIATTVAYEWILLSLFFSALLIQLGYYLLVFLKLPRYKPSKKKKSKKGISIIICAKNEEENLEHFLPRVLEQEYPEFEVVVVNDCSTDGTEQLLSEFSVRYKHLRYTSIPANEKFLHGKKLAVTIGLKSARFDHVLLTDADCYPVSNLWLQNMASNLTSEKKIILGYGGYERRKGLLNLIIRYETVFTAIQYLSYAIKGTPYMGVGRNLAYEKELFFNNKGFASHYHLSSGDDDLFVNETAVKENTAVEISKESHTLSIPKSTFRSWVKQKKRHLSVGTLYKRGSRIRLAGELISRMLLYLALFLLCFLSPWKWIVLALFVIFLIVRMVIFNLGMRRLDEKYLLLPSLLLDPVLPLVLGIIWLSSKFETKHHSWS
ncbi:MAG: glycosyltransferase [Bacteroidota bacterium]